MGALFNGFLRLNALIPGNSHHQTTLPDSTALNGGRLGLKVSCPLSDNWIFSGYASKPAKTTAVTTVVFSCYCDNCDLPFLRLRSRVTF